MQSKGETTMGIKLNVSVLTKHIFRFLLYFGAKLVIISQKMLIFAIKIV